MTGIKTQKLNGIKNTLQDVGFTQKEMDNFLKYQQEQDWLGQQKCLEKKRKRLLTEVHKQGYQIACLDFLKYQLEKERK